MRALFSSSIVLGLFTLATPASAQQVTRLPEGTKNAIGLETGFESAFIARGSYTRRLALDLLREERFFARFTMPVVTPDLSDWSLDAGLQATALSVGDIRLAFLAGPVVRNTENDLFSATALGIGATALFGYEGARWGLSGELGHEQLLATHLGHSARYRDTAYAGAKDGWYATTGSTTRAGLRAGVRFGALELSARAGMAATGYLRPAGPPFVFTLGGSYAF
jgi:hypothetical protein